MITMKQGVPLLMSTELAGMSKRMLLESQKAGEAIMARYGVTCDDGTHWLFVLDDICQQAARAQADAALDSFAEAGAKAWADVPDAAEWQRKVRGETPWYEQATLRDEFAMHAPECLFNPQLDSIQECAEIAYRWADACGVARKQKGSQDGIA